MAEWRSGASKEEAIRDIPSRRVGARAVLDVPLTNGRACVELFAFVPAPAAAATIVIIEGAADAPITVDLSGATPARPRRILIPVQGKQAAASLTLSVRPPITRAEGDNSTAYAVRSPVGLIGTARCPWPQ